MWKFSFSSARSRKVGEICSCRPQIESSICNHSSGLEFSLQQMSGLTLLVAAATALAAPRGWQRREFVSSAASATAGLSLVPLLGVSSATALEPIDSNMLPQRTIKQLEAGRVVEIRNFLPASEVNALRCDAQACFSAGIFKADALASYAQKKNGGSLDPANDRKVMPSFFASKGTDGPWVDPNVGDSAARARFKYRMAELKSELSTTCIGRPTLASQAEHTHEMGYTRYGPGAFLPRHTDEHHGTILLRFAQCRFSLMLPH